MKSKLSINLSIYQSIRLFKCRTHPTLIGIVDNYSPTIETYQSAYLLKCHTSPTKGTIDSGQTIDTYQSTCLVFRPQTTWVSDTSSCVFRGRRLRSDMVYVQPVCVNQPASAKYSQATSTFLCLHNTDSILRRSEDVYVVRQ